MTATTFLRYTPSTPPPMDSIEDVQEWVSRELEEIARLLATQSLLQMEILHVAPAKPRDGMLVYADGSDWDPGSGEGFYGYENGSWVKL